jgi:opacity protein-like surface antigen
MRRIGILSAWIAFFCFSSPAASQVVTDDTPRFQLFVSGLYHTQTFSFTDSRTLPMYLEEGSFRGEWSRETGPAFGLGATYNVVSHLAVGAAFELYNASPSESFRASLPHPLYYARSRSLDGEATSLSYDEKAVHILVSYTRVIGRFVVAAGGGPSYFMTKTEVIDDFTFSEGYPFDEVTLGSIQKRTFDANQIGFNVGGWLGFRLIDQLAVGADIKYTQAKYKFTTGAGNEIELEAGGFRVGAGIRLLF